MAVMESAGPTFVLANCRLTAKVYKWLSCCQWVGTMTGDAIPAESTKSASKGSGKIQMRSWMWEDYVEHSTWYHGLRGLSMSCNERDQRHRKDVSTSKSSWESPAGEQGRIQLWGLCWEIITMRKPFNKCAGGPGWAKQHQSDACSCFSPFKNVLPPDSMKSFRVLSLL